jgi:opacity protein-like surface antigen
MKKIPFIYCSLFAGVMLAQGNTNLLLQYNKGPDLDAFYRTWNFDIHAFAVRVNLTEDYSKPRITYAIGSNVHYKLSKTLGFTSGIGFFNIHHQYELSTNTSKDKLSYLTLPLTVRVSPSRNLILETGVIYHSLLKAKNTFGWLFSVQYNVWKRLNASVQYRFIKKTSDAFSIQKNNFNGLLLGVHYFIFNPRKKPI